MLPALTNEFMSLTELSAIVCLEQLTQYLATQQLAPRIYLLRTKQNTGSTMLSLEVPVLYHVPYRKKHNTTRIFEIQVFTTTDLDGYDK